MEEALNAKGTDPLKTGRPSPQKPSTSIMSVCVYIYIYICRREPDLHIERLLKR